MYDIKMLKAKKIAELIEIAEQIGIKNLKGQKKQEIIDTIVGKSVSKKPTEVKSESDKKSTEVKSESDKKPIHTKSESDKKPIHTKSESDNSNKPYRNDRNPRNMEIKIITIKISLIEKMIILIKIIEGNIKNQTLNLMESLNLKVYLK